MKITLTNGIVLECTLDELDKLTATSRPTESKPALTSAKPHRGRKCDPNSSSYKFNESVFGKYIPRAKWTKTQTKMYFTALAKALDIKHPKQA